MLFETKTMSFFFEFISLVMEAPTRENTFELQFEISDAERGVQVMSNLES